MQIYKCDICGAEIQGPRISVLICNLDERGNIICDFDERGDIIYSKSVGIDACPGCADKLAERIVLARPCEAVKAAEEDEPEEKTEEKPAKKVEKKKLDFDLGKAISLRRGGWTLSKIADEMKCSPQTVANYLERAGVIKKKENVNASNTADV